MPLLHRLAELLLEGQGVVLGLAVPLLPLVAEMVAEGQGESEGEWEGVALPLAHWLAGADAEAPREGVAALL